MNMQEIDKALLVLEAESTKLHLDYERTRKALEDLKVRRDAVLEQRMDIIRAQQMERMGMKPNVVNVPTAHMPAPKGNA